MAECTIIKKYKKPLSKYSNSEIISYFSSNILRSGSFTAIGGDGNYNGGNVSFDWTATKNSIVFIDWSGQGSSFTGSVSFTGGGYQIGSRVNKNPDYPPNHWGVSAYVPSGGKISVSGSTSADEYFSVVGFAILLS